MLKRISFYLVSEIDIVEAKKKIKIYYLRLEK